MNKLYACYGMLVLVLFAVATYAGYDVNSLFNGGHHHAPGDNHYHK